MTESPTTKSDYVGFNATDIISYLSKTYVRKSTRRYFLLHGSPGIGKSTLINVLEHELGITMRRSNASDARKTGDIKLGTFISGGITNSRVCVVLDECDEIPAKTWKKIEEVSKENNRVPIILIANSIKKIPATILKKCQQKELKISRFSLLAFAKRENDRLELGLTEYQINEYVDRCASFRCMKTLLEFGYSDEMVTPKSQNQQILAAMHGEYTEFPTKDLRSLIVIYHDNVTSNADLDKISQACIWLGRYEKGHKYARKIVNCILNGIRSRKDKLQYPRTFVMISKARGTSKQDKKPGGSKKKNVPNIRIIGIK